MMRLRQEFGRAHAFVLMGRLIPAFFCFCSICLQADGQIDSIIFFWMSLSLYMQSPNVDIGQEGVCLGYFRHFMQFVNSVHHFGLRISFRRSRLMFVFVLHFALKMFHLVVQMNAISESCFYSSALQILLCTPSIPKFRSFQLFYVIFL